MDDDLSKYGAVSDAEPDLSKYGSVGASEPKQQEQSGAVSRFLQPLNPLPLLGKLFQSSGNHALDLSGYTLGKNIVGVLTDLGMAQVDMGQKAIKAFHEGDHIEAIAKALAALTPVLGPMSQDAADKFTSGDVAGGLGTLTAMALPEVAERAPVAARAVADVAEKAPPIVGKVAGKLADKIPGVKVAKTVYQVGKAIHEALNEESAPAPVATAAEAAQGAKVTPIRPPLVEPNPPAPPQPAPQPRTGPVRPPLAGQVEAEIQGTAPAATPQAASPPAESPVPSRTAEAEAAAQALGDLGTKDLQFKESNPGTDAYEAEARHLKSDAVAQRLFEHGIPSSDLKLLEAGDPMWKQLFESVGENEPGKFSGDPVKTVEQTIVKLRNLEKSAKPAPAPKPATPTAAPTAPTGMNPKAQAIAQELQAELANAEPSVGAVMKKTRARKPK